MEILLNKIYQGIEPDESKGLKILTMGRRPPKGLIDAVQGKNRLLNEKFGDNMGDGDGDCDCCDCDDCCGAGDCCECDDLSDCFCCCCQ